MVPVDLRDILFSGLYDLESSLQVHPVSRVEFDPFNLIFHKRDLLLI